MSLPFLLYSRDDFRSAVFQRDKNLCVVCLDNAKDAHHIMERRLWPDGGYYLNNGVSLCERHHLKAEMTTHSCEELRQCAGIKETLLPPHLYKDQKYDKWGNPILPNGTRLKGDLFFDESVQKILKEGNVLHLFTDYVKYPRTYHLPWSPGATKDDRVLEDDSIFQNKVVVVTLKMDGENTSIYSDFVHARALSYESHPSRGQIKALQASLANDIPKGWRICGENLTAVHSIKYNDLSSLFQVFSIWNEKNVCLSWYETLDWISMLGLTSVEVVYLGLYDKELIQKAVQPKLESHEGYVIRLFDSFPYYDFRKSVAKYVRKDHVQTHGHWIRQMVEYNSLSST